MNKIGIIHTMKREEYVSKRKEYYQKNKERILQYNKEKRIAKYLKEEK